MYFYFKPVCCMKAVTVKYSGRGKYSVTFRIIIMMIVGLLAPPSRRKIKNQPPIKYYRGDRLGRLKKGQTPKLFPLATPNDGGPRLGRGCSLKGWKIAGVSPSPWRPTTPSFPPPTPRPRPPRDQRKKMARPPNIYL